VIVVEKGGFCTLVLLETDRACDRTSLDNDKQCDNIKELDKEKSLIDGRVNNFMGSSLQMREGAQVCQHPDVILRQKRRSHKLPVRFFIKVAGRNQPQW